MQNLKSYQRAYFKTLSLLFDHQKLTKSKAQQKRLFAYLFVIIALVPTVIYLAKNPLRAKADSFLKFDEGTGTTIRDTQNNVSGTITNAVWQDESFCVFSKCLFFDGTGDFISFGDEADFDFTETANFTISLWFKRAPKTSGTDVLIAKTNASAGYKIQMESDGDLTFAIDDDSTWTPDDTATSTLATYDDNAWHHLAAVKTGTTKIELFIDGQLVASDTSLSSTNTLVNNANFYIGVDGDGSSNYFTGFIDEVNVYTSTAKDGEALKADMIKGAGEAGANTVFGQDQQGLSDGLITYLKMDESSWTGNCSTFTASDASGTGYNAVACPNGSAATTVAGAKFGNGGEFDGTNDFIAIDLPTSITASHSQGTVSFWMRPDWASTTTTTTRFLFGNVSTGSGDGFVMAFCGNDGNCLETPGELVFGAINGGVSESIAKISNSDFSWSADQWVHVAVTWDDGIQTNQNLRIFINGVEPTTTRYQPQNLDISSLSLTSNFWGVGAIINLPYSNFDGTMDEYRLYNKVLSPEEIKTLYQYAPGPVAHWKMDENSGTAFNDSSSTGKTGSFMGSPSWGIGKFSSGINLNGNSYLQVTSPSLPTTDFTYEIWINLTSVSGTQAYFMTSSNTGSSNELLITSNNDDLSVTLNSVSDIVVANNILVANRWQHIAVTREGNLVEAFVDGVLVGTGTNSDILNFGTCQLLIGMDNDGSSCNGTPSDYLIGKIDDARIYNYARTPSQIIQDMHASYSSEGSSLSKTPILHYKFDEGYGDTTNSSGPQNTTGNLSGSTTCPSASICPTWSDDAKLGKSLYFGALQTANGDSHIRLPNNIYDSQAEGAISFWFKVDPASAYNDIFGVAEDDNGGGSDFIGIMYDANENALNIGASNNGSFLLNAFTEPISNPDTQWHHAVWNMSATGNEIYIDGKKQNMDYQTGSASTNVWFDDVSENTTAYTIGCSDTDGSDTNDCATLAGFYRGYLDEFKIFTAPLSAEEVAFDYNQNKASVMGSTGTNASGETDNSTQRAYCPPGNSEGRCGSGNPSPIAHWRLDENTGTTANDSTGNANIGTLTSGPTWATGRVGQAVRLDGSNDYVNVPYSANLDPTANLTISFWFRPDSTIQSGFSGTLGLISKAFSNTDSQNDWQFSWFDSHDGRLRFGTYGDNIQTNTATWTANTWYHITTTVSSTNTANIYVNGKLDTYLSDADISSSPINGSQNTPLLIGLTRTVQGDFYFDGTIDDLKIYDYARTPTQIAWDYNLGKPMGHWKLDENSGAPSTMYDGGIYEMHGTAYGSMDSGDWTEGKYNSALDFDGSDDVVAVPNQSSIDLNESLQAGFTFAAWIFPDSSGENGNGRVFSKGPNDGSSDGSVSLRVTDSSPGYVEVGGFLDMTSTDCDQTVASIPTNQWSHVAISYEDDADDDVTIWVNATPYTCTASGSPAAENYDLYLGGNGTSTNNTRAFDGKIDDFQVFYYALNQTQIKSIMNLAAVQF